ncbi:hypothetical protein SDC9_172183 [bioreactor metagenome]|uniref:Uncharacterized protein n=1 Tax=bioreactor metagenome TaxID=1076179 RepID=A0A645GCZ5_9ZZZZ
MDISNFANKLHGIFVLVDHRKYLHAFPACHPTGIDHPQFRACFRIPGAQLIDQAQKQRLILFIEEVCAVIQALYRTARWRETKHHFKRIVEGNDAIIQ